jgi:hypothetical protein
MPFNYWPELIIDLESFSPLFPYREETFYNFSSFRWILDIIIPPEILHNDLVRMLPHLMLNKFNTSPKFLFAKING